MGSPGGALCGLLKFKQKPGAFIGDFAGGVHLDVFFFKSWGQGSILLWGHPRLPWGVFAKLVFGASLGRWTRMLACLCACCSLPRLSPQVMEKPSAHFFGNSWGILGRLPRGVMVEVLQGAGGVLTTSWGHTRATALRSLWGSLADRVGSLGKVLQNALRRLTNSL